MNNKLQDQAVDVFGNPLSVGDEVVFMQVGYRNFIKGIITHISPQKLYISHEKLSTNHRTETIQRHNQVVKYTQPQTTK